MLSKLALLQLSGEESLVHRLTEMEQREYDARYEIEVNVAIGACLDDWTHVSTDTRTILGAELRSALELRLRDEIRALFKVRGAAA